MDVPVLYLKDAEERRRQYIESILYYIEKSSINNIVYCDNSNASPDPIVFETARRKNKQVEWLSFVGDQEKVAQYGKGYGEGEIIDHALRNSKLLQDAQMMIKITGRLIIKNIDCYLKKANVEKSYFLPGATPEKELFIDTRMYIMPVSLYKTCFRDVHLRVDDRNGFFLEHAFGKAIKDNRIRFRYFWTAPKFEGMSGSLGHRYRVDRLSCLKNTLRLYKNNISVFLRMI